MRTRSSPSSRARPHLSFIAINRIADDGGAEAAAAAKQQQKEAEKKRQEEAKKQKAHTDNASATLDLLKDAAAQLQEEMTDSREPDEYLKQACELALEKAKKMMTQATSTLADGCALPFDLTLVKAVQAEAISKTRTSRCNGALWEGGQTSRYLPLSCTLSLSLSPICSNI